jgi:hypothetical protein
MVLRGFGGRRAGVREWAKRGAAVAVLVGVAGCASVGGLSKDTPAEAKQAAVTQRVQARWAAMIDGNLELAYTFLSPASKGIVSLEQFKRQARTGYREAKVQKVECDGALCKVQLMVTYDHKVVQGMTTPLAENWVIDEGQAWLVW